MILTKQAALAKLAQDPRPVPSHILLVANHESHMERPKPKPSFKSEGSVPHAHFSAFFVDSTLWLMAPDPREDPRKYGGGDSKAVKAKGRNTAAPLVNLDPKLPLT